MRWWRRFRIKRLLRTQEIILEQIKTAKAAESQCITAALITSSPYAKLKDGDLMATAREWRRHRREHQAHFLYLQKRVDQLLRE